MLVRQRPYMRYVICAPCDRVMVMELLSSAEGVEAQHESHVDVYRCEECGTTTEIAKSGQPQQKEAQPCAD